MNEKVIWDFLMDKTANNANATAGIMGNLYAESALNPKNLQQSFEKSLGMTDDSYTAGVDNGTYKNFIKDKAGYGLAQWTYYTRKQKLLEYAKSVGTSIGDLNMQLTFLWNELQTYSDVRKIISDKTKTLRQVSDAILTQYERPKDQSESVKVKRAGYGQKYYDEFINQKTTEVTEMATINYKKYIESTGTHYISNSGKDENNKYNSGTAGDQTGHEWELKAWYNRPWTVVLRYSDPKVALTIAELGIAAALNNKIGYDQYQRSTYWTQLQKANYNPSNIKTACEADCTAGVSANVKATGYLLDIKALKDIGVDTYSGNMKSRFVKAGFKALTAKKYIGEASYLLPGDILLYESHHAATNISYGKKAEKFGVEVDIPAGSNEEIEINYNYVDVAHGNYYIRTGPGTSYSSIGVSHVGDKLEYLDEAKSGWFKVRFEGQEGWISGKCGDIVTVEVKEETKEYLTVKKGSWNVRTGPSVLNKSLGVVKGGEKLLSLKETKNNWYKVEYSSQEGWISGKGIEK